ncbi:unnamed protein product [Arctia plantaginis]|uniref:Uncharacterized protein n=2 Tax=Arctia plantaginis TaxID=874455 RepID=A0A8S1AQD8_ARCPL|nr:unnamed protein product [Arctia plantaginis]
MEFFQIALLLLYLGSSQSSVYTNIRETVQSILNSARDADNSLEREPTVQQNALGYFRQQSSEAADNLRARDKADILRKARTIEHRLNNGRDIPPNRQSGDPKIGKEYYHMDPVLNHVKRRSRSSSEKTSSSLEMDDWKEEFNNLWLEKKFEAINTTRQEGDQVNMVAARPWGVPCGDPNQHDMPWGSCMMTSECEPEYRIYRGDYFCGRTLYICCALQYTNYDLYQGFDVSFAETSFETDSEEKKAREKDSRENRKKNKHKQKRKREKERRRRKRKIKKKIRRIVYEIRKILNRSFRNASHHRKKRTIILKKYIKMLKRQYKKDRKSVRDIHIYDMERIDEALQKRLEQIREVNKNFMLNSTFRDILVNGTINKVGARMLAQAYPDLIELLRGRLRRDGGGKAEGQESDGKNDDYQGYDIEYGALYY